MERNGDDADATKGTESVAVLREESREVLNHQIEVIRGIDEKAMWLVRTAVIVTSVVVSGAGIAGRSFLAQNWAAVVFATAGIAALLFVSIWGSILFAASRVPFGPSRSMTAQLSEAGLRGGETHRVLLRGYQKWIGDARREAEANASAFTSLQLGFVAAVFLLGTSGTVVGAASITDTSQWMLLAAGTVLSCGLVLYISTTNPEVRA